MAFLVQFQQEELNGNEATQALANTLNQSTFEKVRNAALITDTSPPFRDCKKICRQIYESLPLLREVELYTELSSQQTRNWIGSLQKTAKLFEHHSITTRVFAYLPEDDESKNLSEIDRLFKTLHRTECEFLTHRFIYRVNFANVWYIDKLFDLCRRWSIPIIFEFQWMSDSLMETSDVSFNADKAYQLMLFFKMLELRYEKDRRVRSIYRRYRKVLLENGSREPRSVGLPIDYQLAILDVRGQILHLPTQNQGKDMERSPLAKVPYLFAQAPPTGKEILEKKAQSFWRSTLNLDRGLWLADRLG
jgi:hypothetical protein